MAVTVRLFLLLLALCTLSAAHAKDVKSPATVDPAALERHVRMLSQEFVPRSAADVANLAKTADYIARHLEATGAAVSFQSYEVDGRPYKNVIARYGLASEEITVVGAHYDAYSNLPGADDNASGVAGLLELGRLLGQRRPDHRVELVAYTLEEPPYFGTAYMGSAVHARSLKAPGAEIRVMISLEMIGYFTDEPDSQEFPVGLMRHLYPDKGNFIAVIDQLVSTKGFGVKAAIERFTDLPVQSLNAPAFVTGVDFSDHRNYWSAGYPAVMVTDTAFFRNKAYHTPRDTYDRLDYTKMAKVVYGVFKYLTEGGR